MSSAWRPFTELASAPATRCYISLKLNSATYFSVVLCCQTLWLKNVFCCILLLNFDLCLYTCEFSTLRLAHKKTEGNTTNKTHKRQWCCNIHITGQSYKTAHCLHVQIMLYGHYLTWLSVACSFAMLSCCPDGSALSTLSLKIYTGHIFYVQG